MYEILIVYLISFVQRASLSGCRGHVSRHVDKAGLCGLGEGHGTRGSVLRTLADILNEMVVM